MEANSSGGKPADFFFEGEDGVSRRFLPQLRKGAILRDLKERGTKKGA